MFPWKWCCELTMVSLWGVTKTPPFNSVCYVIVSHGYLQSCWPPPPPPPPPPLENYFSHQRAQGSRCDNPTAGACLTAQSIRVQGSTALQPVRGNCSRKRRLFSGKEVIDDTPLRKRARSSKKKINKINKQNCL